MKIMNNLVTTMVFLIIGLITPWGKNEDLRYLFLTIIGIMFFIITIQIIQKPKELKKNK